MRGLRSDFSRVSTVCTLVGDDDDDDEADADAQVGVGVADGGSCVGR